MSTPRIRVLRIIARMNVGGPALQISGLARQLDPDRFEHVILCGEVEPGEADWLQLRAPDVQVVHIPGLARSIGTARELRALRAIRREIARFRPDIVHTHAAKAGVLGRLATTIGRPRHRPLTVHTFHGHLLQGYFGTAGTFAVKMTERFLARRTTALVAVGSAVRDELLAAGVGRSRQYHVVAPGLELPPMPTRSAARAQLNLDDHIPVVAFVARLTQIKRPDRLLATVRALQSLVPDLVVLVVGDGPLAEPMQHNAQDLGPTVRFLGWRADVETVYAAADVALLTSDNEGMPVSLIEASWCATPCVSTAVGSVAEVVLHEHTGFVTNCDPLALATATAKILCDPVFASQMGAAAQRHAQKNFSLSRLVNDHEGLYDHLVHDRGDR